MSTQAPRRTAVIRNIDDALALPRDPIQYEQVHLELTELPESEFDEFNSAFGRAILSPALRDVHTASLGVNKVDWECNSAVEFMMMFKFLFRLEHFIWNDSESKVPVFCFTIVCCNCSRLKTMSLTGLHFLTAQATYTVDDYGVISQTLIHCCAGLQRHSCLQIFKYINCSMRQVQEAYVRHENQSTPMRDEQWVEKLLKALSYPKTLEAIVIQVAPDPESNDNQGKVMVGLCKKGEIATSIMQHLHELFMQREDQQQTFCAYKKVRLWIADGYAETTESIQTQLLGLCQALVGNTWLKDFRIRSNVKQYITDGVKSGYKELLESARNVDLTNCDLMEVQGGQIDFLCRLNGLDREELLQRILSMTQQEFVQDIIVRFASDLDVLYHWNRLQPEYIASLA